MIRLSKTLDASVSELLTAVREEGFEGVVAKRRDSSYEAGERSGAWQKMRVLQRRDLVIGGYTPGGRNFDSILVGYYEGRKLMYVAKVRAGFTPASRDEVFKRLRGLASETCPFKNLPEPRRGQWGDGLTANDHRRSMNSWPRS